jgi:hypothetical protein
VGPPPGAVDPPADVVTLELEPADLEIVSRWGLVQHRGTHPLTLSPNSAARV